MKKLRDKMVQLGLDTSKLDEITEQVETKEMYKVYIFYEFFGWEDSIEDERFVLYTEDESLANDYFSILQEVEEVLTKVEEAFASNHGEGPVHFFTARLEKVSVQNIGQNTTDLTGRKED